MTGIHLDGGAFDRGGGAFDLDSLNLQSFYSVHTSGCSHTSDGQISNQISL